MPCNCDFSSCCKCVLPFAPVQPPPSKLRANSNTRRAQIAWYLFIIKTKRIYKALYKTRMAQLRIGTSSTSCMPLSPHWYRLFRAMTFMADGREARQHGDMLATKHSKRCCLARLGRMAARRRAGTVARRRAGRVLRRRVARQPSFPFAGLSGLLRT
jgi:hypothetical protein